MKKKFKIGLKDNGIHSLNRGLETFELYEEEKDDFILKESIMFLHHGIELLMKQVLIENAGEYLIYSDISDDTVKKVISAKKQGISVFDLLKPPHTSTYLEVIGRVRAFVNNPELEESLDTRLRELNKTRNNLEHYAIDVDVDKVENLISNIKNPLIKFLEDGLSNFKKEDAKKVKRNWQNIDNRILESERIENEVYQLIKKVQGQIVPGQLLGVEGTVELPNFSEVIKNYRFKHKDRMMELDILAKDNTSSQWIIEVKSKSRNFKAVDQVLSSISIVKGIPWVIVFDTVNEKFKEYAREKGVFITGLSEWSELIKLIKNEKS